MSSAASLSPSALVAALWASRVQFFLTGFLFAAWGVHVPTLRAHYGLTEQALGLVMLAGGLGALLAFARVPQAVHRWGPRRLLGVAGVLLSALLPALLATTDVAVLVLTMVVFGSLNTLADVSVNAQGTELERAAGRPVLSGFHAMFSLGGMAGAGLGSLAFRLGWPPGVHLGVVAALGVLGYLLAATAVQPGPAPHDSATAQVPATAFVWPRGPLLIIGVLAVLALISEGAMYDWSVLYMQQDLGEPPERAAWAYFSFTAAMAATRLCGDWVRAQLSPAQLLRGGATLATVAMAFSLLVAHPMASLVGFALVGVGMAAIVPVIFMAATQVPGVSAAQGIAAVSAVGYLGIMAGPPLIGLLAHHSSLGLALGAVVLCSALLAVLAPQVPGGGPRRVAGQAPA